MRELCGTRESAAPRLRQAHALLVAEVVAQPSGGVREADPDVIRDRGDIRRPRTVVLDAQEKPVSAPFGDDVEMAATRAPADAMPERVLDEWLQQQNRHACLAHRLVHVERDAQAVAEAQPHDREVVLEQVELLAQRHQLATVPPEHGAQKVAELLEKILRGVGVVAHERRRHLERVEEEVRL